MSNVKTSRNDGNVDAFLQSVENDTRRKDALTALHMMKELTGAPPQMWGSSIVGFGSYHYQYASGREGDWFRVGFSPRKQSMTFYIMPGFERYGELLSKLGKYKTGKACLYINKLQDVDQEVLKELISESLTYMNHKYPE